MSMLDRYRKPGGFYQLVSLVETCGPAKQEKFLEIIRTESPAWADAIRTKMIDMNRIYSWKDDTLAEIIGTLQDLTVAIALHAANDALRTRIYAMLTHGRRRKIEDLFGSNNPSPGEVTATHLKMIETVRKMAHDGYLRFDKFDPQLFVDDKIEEELNKVHSTASASVSSTATSAAHSEFAIQYENSPQRDHDRNQGDKQETKHEVKLSAVPDNASSGGELALLKKKIAEISKENAVLRHELSIARSKLDQIKKIA